MFSLFRSKWVWWWKLGLTWKGKYGLAPQCQCHPWSQVNNGSSTHLVSSHRNSFIRHPWPPQSLGTPCIKWITLVTITTDSFSMWSILILHKQVPILVEQQRRSIGGRLKSNSSFSVENESFWILIDIHMFLWNGIIPVYYERKATDKRHQSWKTRMKIFWELRLCWLIWSDGDIENSCQCYFSSLSREFNLGSCVNNRRTTSLNSFYTLAGCQLQSLPNKNHGTHGATGW